MWVRGGRWKVKKNFQLVLHFLLLCPLLGGISRSLLIPTLTSTSLCDAAFFLSHVAMLPDGGGGSRNTGGCWNKSLSLVGGFCSEMRGLPFKPGNSLSSLLFPFIQDKWKAIYLPVGLKTLTPDFHQMTACCLFAVVRRHNWYFSIQSNVWVSASRVCVVFPVHQRSGENAQDFYLRPDA